MKNKIIYFLLIFPFLLKAQYQTDGAQCGTFAAGGCDQFEAPCPTDGYDILKIIIQSDHKGHETRWLLRDETLNEVVAAVAGLENNTLYVIPICIQKSHCYSFSIEDEGEDGLALGEGHYEIFLNGENIKTGGNFEAGETTNVGSGCCDDFSVNLYATTSCLLEGQMLVYLDIQGGTPPYSVQWSDGSTNNCYRLFEINDDEDNPPPILAEGEDGGGCLDDDILTMEDLQAAPGFIPELLLDTYFAPDLPCDDGNPQTENDKLNEDCECEGTPTQSNIDFEVTNMLFEEKGPGVYDVRPVVNVFYSSTEEAPLLLHLLVDGEVVGTDEMHSIRAASNICANDQPPCQLSCQLDLYSMNTIAMLPGTCTPLENSCECKNDDPIQFWPFKNITIPNDAEVKLVIDPNNEYTETDEDNNSFKVNFNLVSMNLECPDNLIIPADSPVGAFVNWEEPAVSTNCPISGLTNCPTNLPGFSYLGELEGHRYFLSFQATFWQQAKNKCENLGGNLLIINTPEEQQMLEADINTIVHIGLSDAADEGIFEWTDGSSPAITHWAPAFQNSGSKDFGVYNPYQVGWNLVPYFSYHRYILELPCSIGFTNLQQMTGAANGGLFPIGETVVTYLATDFCDNEAACNFTITVENFDTEYCEIEATAPWQEWISAVHFNTIENASAKEGYGDFTNLNTSVNIGASYDLEVQIDFSYFQFDEFIYAWIDFNRDGDFEDAGELVLSEFYIADLPSVNPAPFISTVQIPYYAQAGMTRMRVAMRRNTPPNACESFDYGEVEDYSILIKNQQSPQGLIALGNDNSSNENIEIYPNPASEELFMLAQNFPKGEVFIQITNVYGNVVWEQEMEVVSESPFRIGLSDFPAGSYYLNLRGEGSVRFIRKFVIVR